MAQKLWYLVSYDVRDPKRLRQVAQHLEGYGERIQFSVFRCRLSEREVERLRWELTTKMKTEDDLLIVGLCARCGVKISERHGQDKWSQDPETFSVL